MIADGADTENPCRTAQSRTGKGQQIPRVEIR
jgi:hypothetical protein